MLTTPGRAVTDEQKRAVMERLLAAWMRMPMLRLGQLLEAATDQEETAVFFVEDDALARCVEIMAGVEE